MSSKVTLAYEPTRRREKKAIIVDREFDRLYAEHGTLTTDLVLETAKDEDHPLHKYFEWDDSVAAQKYRQAQATAMLLASKMVLLLQREENGIAPKVVSAERTEVRRLVAPFRGGGFKMRNAALSVEDERQALIERKKASLRGWCRETADIAELAEIRAAILKLV